MTNTMKAIAFITSLFVFIFFFIIVNTVVPAGTLLESPNAALISALLYMAGFIIVLYTQALVKYLYYRKNTRAFNIMKTFSVATFEVKDRLLILLLPLLAVLLPMLGQKSITADSLRSLLYVAILALIIEILYRLNSITLKAYIGDKGVAVGGIDFRLELPLHISYNNAVGFYPYDRIENYLALSDKVIIYQTYDFSTITINCSEEDVRQIKGLLASKKIPERRY